MAENVRNASQTIGTTALIVSPELLEGERNVIAITNTSTAGQIISISWGSTATALTGAVLYPAGSWSESIDTAFRPSQLAIWAVSSAAGGTIAIEERILSKV